LGDDSYANLQARAEDDEEVKQMVEQRKEVVKKMVGMVVPEVQIVIMGVGPDFWVELCCLLRYGLL
jgi:hypothetical protein